MRRQNPSFHGLVLTGPSFPDLCSTEQTGTLSARRIRSRQSGTGRLLGPSLSRRSWPVSFARFDFESGVPRTRIREVLQLKFQFGLNGSQMTGNARETTVQGYLQRRPAFGLHHEQPPALGDDGWKQREFRTRERRNTDRPA